MAEDPAEIARRRREQIEGLLEIAEIMSERGRDLAVKGVPVAAIDAEVKAIGKRVEAICLHLGLVREESDERSTE